MKLGTLAFLAAASFAAARPNIIVILCDNLGNGDIACFNPQTKHRTPNLDKMAAEGRKFTSFYSASGVCTPSRAALMTGCYPRRVGLHISAIGAAVLQPVATRGIHPGEETMAELLKQNGYATACFGKWHLGDQPDFLPTRNGFDSYFGIPYSEDMVHDKFPEKGWPPLPLMQDEKVIEAPVAAETLTQRFTEAAVNWIRQHREQPFFLYFPEAGPGSRKECYPGPAFRGKSANGLYGDSIEELDWSTGEILQALKDNHLDENTLVIWTNDNGAVNRTPAQGSNAPYKGMGYSTSEGGQRMPCIARWPGKVPAGTTCTQLCTMMDMLPTLAAVTGAKPPQKPIDGHDIRPLLFGEKDAHSPYDGTGFFYFNVKQLQAVREGDWKLYLPLSDKGGIGTAKGKKPIEQKIALYDVQTDVAEENDLSAQQPGIVQRLLQRAEAARRTLGDGDARGSQQREAGHVEKPTPRVKAAH
ncbi:MAG: sulfatase [Verrucomicrobiaceae bacterium]|nr:sulfatase [Verrucomicrobiaceae bacterium]